MKENQSINIGNFELATSKQRIRAFVIDDLLISFISLLLLWETISKANGDILVIATIMNKAFIQIIIIKIIYQTFFIWYYGATIGKIVTKIKVIDFENLTRVTFTQAFLRSVSRIVSESIFYFGFILSFFTPLRQTLHDKLAKTLVVNV